MHTSKTFSACGLGAVLALAGTAMLPAVATAAGEPAAVSSATSSQMVVRDAATGQLRAPTPEEAKALQPARATQRTLTQPLQRQHASGARGARLTDDFMSYSVMVRQPDGRLVEQCVESKQAADAAVSDGAASASSTQSSRLPTE